MRYALVVVGTSLGGTAALRAVLSELPGTFPLPIAVVIHRPPQSDDHLPVYFQRGVALGIEEARDKLLPEPGHVYIAPADYHLLVEQGHFALSTDEPVCAARPSVDVMFDSAAAAYGQRLIGVILTGHGKDGAEGLAAVARHGGVTIVQQPETAEAPEMPEAALAAVHTATTLPLEAIGPHLAALVS